MSNTSLEEFKIMAGYNQPFNPATLNDPVAMQTGWTPARGGGTNFRTHRLVTIDTSRVEFRQTVQSMLFHLLFLLIGLAVLYLLFFVQVPAEGFSFNMGTMILLLLGSVFSGVGGVSLYRNSAGIAFDKGKGLFWKGRKTPGSGYDDSVIKCLARLDQIHALQLVAEYLPGKNSYYSYELNLVLENGDRINVIDHGSLIKIRQDAAILSEFLARPVWDAT